MPCYLFSISYFCKFETKPYLIIKKPNWITQKITFRHIVCNIVPAFLKWIKLLTLFTHCTIYLGYSHLEEWQFVYLPLLFRFVWLNLFFFVCLCVCAFCKNTFHVLPFFLQNKINVCEVSLSTSIRLGCELLYFVSKKVVFIKEYKYT